MKKYFKLQLVLLLSCAFTSGLLAQNSSKVIVEVFTNSHCSSCGAAYTNLNNNVFNQEYAKNMVFVAYHVNTYNDDKLYQETKTESIPRASWYSGITGTPTFFINGKKYTQGSLSQNIQNSITQNKTMDIGLTCTIEKDSLVINSSIMNSAENSNLKYFIVVAENVNYKGRNGHENHRNVMRTMPTTPAGESISLSNGMTKQFNNKVAINSLWNLDSISVIVFVQNELTKEIYNTAIRSRNEFITATVDEYVIENLKLFPQPNSGKFNLSFNSIVAGKAMFGLYNISGKLLTEQHFSTIEGNNLQTIDFSNLNLSNGVYSYILELDGKKQIGKLIIN